MPTPARTSLDEIVATGREVVEAEGLEGLTMKKVATKVGVRAPSLYKHVANRGELVKLIMESVAADLGRLLEDAVSGEDAIEDLQNLARAFRSFARSQPDSYRLLIAPIPEEWRPEREVLEDASAAVLRTASALAGPTHALEAARLITAWVYGFMSMELAGAFRLQGDVDAAFTYGVERLAVAISQ